MISGLIIEIGDQYATIVTKDGLFLKIKLYGAMVEGQTVLITEEDLFMETQTYVKKSNNRLHTGILSVIAASLVLIAGSVTWFTATYNSVYTAVMVDINPRIEIDLNRNNKVVKTIAHNEDALSLALADLQGLSIEDALETLIAEAGAKGFLKAGDSPYVLVTTVAMKNQSLDALEQRIKAKFDDSAVLQKTNMALTSVTPEELANALDKQVPAGLVTFTPSETTTSVKSFFSVQSNVSQFSDNGVVLKGSSADTVSSATTQSSSNDSTAERLNDLKERLAKLKAVSNPSAEIKAFIVKAEAYLATGTGDLAALTSEAKTLWDAVKDSADDSSDDKDDKEDDDKEDDDKDDDGDDD